MKKFLILSALLSCSFFCFSYSYKGEAFEIDLAQIKSLESDDFAEVEGNILTTTRNGNTSVLKLSKSNPKKINSGNVERISKTPVVQTHDALVDFFTRLAAEEVQKNIRDDGTFAAGAKWPTAWTRDLSYSVDLSLSFLFPENVEKALAKRVENGVILQDTGSGGSWPVSTDRLTWAIAAYKYALYKQDPEYFKWVRDVISKTFFNSDFYVTSGALFKGESTFLDWREQTYPRWATNEVIANSYALGTNVVACTALNILSKLSELTGEDSETVHSYKSVAEDLKTGIRENFTDYENGRFASLILNDVYTNFYGGFDNLGSSLAVLYDVALEQNFKSTLTYVKPGKWGMPVVAPQLAGVPSYHNDAVWPFVQAYRIMALKKAGCIKECEDEFASMLYAASMFQTFKENYVSSTFSEDTQTNSDRQLWSCAGFLGCIYRVLCGLDFTDSGLAIKPLVFDSFKDGIFLRNFKFGKNTLNLEVTGNGDKVSRFFVNGNEVSVDYVIPYDSEENEFTVSLQMEKSQDYKASYNSENKNYLFDSKAVIPASPIVSVEYDKKKAYVSWKSLWKNGFNISGSSDFSSKEKEFEIKPGKFAQIYQISCEPEDKNIPVFPSKAIRVESPKNTWFIEAEDSEISGGTVYSDEEYDEETPEAKVSSDLEKVVPNKGKFVEKWGSETGSYISFNFNAKKAGTYIVDFRFKNGHGPVNTGEKCAVSSVIIDDVEQSENPVRYISFPQQGSWSSWSFSVPLKCILTKGQHKIILAVDEYCKTQHGALNYISVDLMRISQIE